MKEQKTKADDAKNEKIAVVLIRGLVRVNTKIKETLKMLNIIQNHECVIVDKNPSMLGMILKCKDYVTYGEIDDETHKQLVERRGREYKGCTSNADKKMRYDQKYIEYCGKKLKPYFRLSPPRGGFERKGTKTAFSRGGALGYRGSEINDLIKRML